MAFVRDEGASLDVSVRAHLLLSLCAASEDALRELADDARSLLRSAETDDEDWIRATAAVVRRALPVWLVGEDEPRGADALDAAVRDALSRLEPRAPKDRVALPVELCPVHWPLVAYDSLPASFVELLAGQANPHFSSGLPPPPAIKQHQRQQAGAAAGAAAGARRALPPKVQEMIKDAPLLTEEGRAKLERFFSAPASITQVEFVLLSETRKEVPGKPTEVDQVLVKLDPIEKKVARVTKRKLLAGAGAGGAPLGPHVKRLSVVTPAPPASSSSASASAPDAAVDR